MDTRIKVLIVEDEALAAKRLVRMLEASDFDIDIDKICDAVETSVAYLENKPDIDLLIMDIKLGDGLSLDIFEQVAVHKPVIFTTAYDDFALKAFKHLSIDYLLKPIDQDELNDALAKYVAVFRKNDGSQEMNDQVPIFHQSYPYRERYLVKSGRHLIVVPLKDVMYFMTENGLTFMVTNKGKKYLIDDTLEKIQKEVDPEQYFRINRSMLITCESIEKIETYFNSRYTLTLTPSTVEQVIVSRDRAKDFKVWLEK